MLVTIKSEKLISYCCNTQYSKNSKVAGYYICHWGITSSNHNIKLLELDLARYGVVYYDFEMTHNS